MDLIVIYFFIMYKNVCYPGHKIFISSLTFTEVESVDELLDLFDITQQMKEILRRSYREVLSSIPHDPAFRASEQLMYDVMEGFLAQTGFPNFPLGKLPFYTLHIYSGILLQALHNIAQSAFVKLSDVCGHLPGWHVQG